MRFPSLLSGATAALTLLVCAEAATAQMPIPAFVRTFASTTTRGFFFQAPTTFIITGLRVPDEASAGVQNVEVFVMQTQPPAFPGTGNTGQVFYAAGVPSSQIISTSILVQGGEWVGVLGACGTATMQNSYGANGPFTSDILGNPVVIDRFLTQTNLATSGGNQPYSTEPGFNIGRVEVYVAPAQGAFANFTATPTSGASPLAVQFTDTSITSDPGGITSWAWDFENDGTVDSTIQNPPFTYNTCGAYDVTLTVTDATNPSSTTTKTAFIDVDPQLRVDANFSATPQLGAAPLAVNFTDASTGTPTSWAWDLDGDNVVDSTIQNPSFSYNVAGRYDVTLTAGNACFSGTTTRVGYIVVVGGTSNNLSSDILEYQFNEVRGDTTYNCASTTLAPEFGVVSNSAWQADNGRPLFMGNEPGFGCMGFGTASVVDSGWPVNLSGDLTVSFWLRRDPASTGTNPFGYAFGDGTFRAFTAGAGGTGILFRGSTAGIADLTTIGDVVNTPGWNHWALVVDNTAGTCTWYFNGAMDAQNAFAPGAFGYSGTNNFSVGGNNGSSSINAHYDMDDFRMSGRALTQSEIAAAVLSENPTNSTFDAGCPDLGGIVPKVSANSAPLIPNATYQIDLTNAEPGRAVAMVIGFSAHVGGGLPLPLPALGATCDLGVFPDILLNFNTGPGNITVPTPIPGGPWQAGFHIYTQFVILGTAGAITPVLDTNLQQ